MKEIKVSIFRPPAHTNANNLLAKGNAVLARARPLGSLPDVHREMLSLSQSSPVVISDTTTHVGPRPCPYESSSRRARHSQCINQCLPTFDRTQPPRWCAFFMHLAMSFALPVPATRPCLHTVGT